MIGPDDHIHRFQPDQAITTPATWSITGASVRIGANRWPQKSIRSGRSTCRAAATARSLWASVCGVAPPAGHGDERPHLRQIKIHALHHGLPPMVVETRGRLLDRSFLPVVFLIPRPPPAPERPLHQEGERHEAMTATGRPGPSVELTAVDQPRPRPDEALVKVEAYSVNRGETFQLEAPRAGWRPGKDVAGLVVQAAADGSGPAAGTRVAGRAAGRRPGRWPGSPRLVSTGRPHPEIGLVADWTGTDPKTVVVRYVEAVRDGDAEMIVAGFADDATWLYPGNLPISGLWEGRDTIVNGFLGGMGRYLDTQHVAYVLFAEA